MSFINFMKEYRELSPEERQIGKDFAIWASKNYNIFDLAFNKKILEQASNEYKDFRLNKKENDFNENKDI